MPFYDYRCKDCQTKQTLFYKTYTAYDQAVPVCTACGSENMSRRIGRIAIAKGEDARMDALADNAMATGFDENDPRSMGQFMRKMSREMGEDMGEEFNEVVDRLEKGQEPEAIEKDMPGLADSMGADVGGAASIAGAGGLGDI